MLDTLIRETGENPTHAVIWLHGLGADATDFVPVIPMLGLTCPTRFIFPNAPVQPVTVNGGMAMPSWYDIYEMQIERKIDRAGIQASADAIAALIDEQVERGIARANIFVAGFSQGGAVALYLLESGVQMAGVLALSTYSPNLDQPAPSPLANSIAVSIHHGTQDPVVPEVLGQRTQARVAALGCAVSYQTWPMAHSVLPEQLTAIGQWLNEHSR
ncbi:carboxylesterase [Litorivicinus lipolyticus]|uniref:Carboxylesterase n=1 Tax=Litorivicinus lipolyticus TaxID=418701 RepID=A0A5Q2QEG4_9GAMM|nr:carboxylesterase [Litorivicinus lipolyticus]QGG80722.1 carboxylesterase [Litorivicinus lipolyticus]